MALVNGICHDKIPFMTMKTTIDRAGRLVLPKPLRDNLQLEPGDWLSVDSNENEIVIRPLRGEVPLQKKRGIWTFGSGEPLSLEQVNQTAKQIRRERDLDILGHRGAQTSRRGKKAKLS
jgi:AbrB family looped-hinge helix DNA binding protein